jgi:hypothetical protein
VGYTPCRGLLLFVALTHTLALGHLPNEPIYACSRSLSNFAVRAYSSLCRFVRPPWRRSSEAAASASFARAVAVSPIAAASHGVCESLDVMCLTPCT